MKCRKVQDDVETRGNSLTWDESGGWPDFCPGGSRHEGGVTLIQASMWNAGTCRPDAKGEIQAGACLDFSLRIGATGSRVPHRSLDQSHAAFMPAAAWAEIRPSPRLVPG